MTCATSSRPIGSVRAVRERASSSFAHVLVGEPASTSLEHALGRRRRHRERAVLLHAGDDHLQQAIAELRILEVELLEAVVVEYGGVHFGYAAHRHGAPSVGREQADLTEQGAFAERLA